MTSTLEAAPAPVGGRPVVPSTLAYNPALDGLRGVAVAAVLLFHAGFRWARGGFLGVSTFFTLSGFLITSLLLQERAKAGGISLGRFYGRRLRRLLPASLACLGLVLLFASTIATPLQRVSVRGDVLSALGYVANWRFVLSGRSYAALFQAPSLLQHFWSLAIEEQFYLLFPPLIAWIVSPRGSSVRAVQRCLVALLAGSAAMTVVLQALGASTDRIYYGTDTRAFELLLGALLATTVVGRGLADERRATRILGPGALAALGGTVVAFAIVAQPSRWLYWGGLWGFAALSATMVAGCQYDTTLRRLLAVEPLRQLGLISYGAYLYHWPLYQMITRQRTGLGTLPLFAARVLATLGVSLLSYRLLEKPVRERRLFPSPRDWIVAPTAIAVVAVLTFLATLQAPAGVVDLAAGQRDFQNIGQDTPAVAGSPTMAVFGDSTALPFGIGVDRWARETGQISFRPGAAIFGCGVLAEGEVNYRSAGGDQSKKCAVWRSKYEAVNPDIDAAVFFMGAWDVADHRFTPGGPWLRIGEAEYDRRLGQAMEDKIRVVTRRGAKVLWVTYPYIRLDVVSDGSFTADDPARMDAYNQMIKTIAAKYPDKVAVVDLAAYLQQTRGSSVDLQLMPDGVHMSNDSAAQLARDYLGPALVEAYRRLR